MVLQGPSSLAAAFFSVGVREGAKRRARSALLAGEQEQEEDAGPARHFDGVPQAPRGRTGALSP